MIDLFQGGTQPFPEVEHCTSAWEFGKKSSDSARVIKVSHGQLTYKFTFIKPLKRAGTKEVWRCRQRILDNGRWAAGDDVVIKFDTAQWIENEVKTLHYLSKPGHPNIVPLLLSFICTNEPDRLYMVMPYYPNGDLLDLVNQHIHDRTRLTNEDLADIFGTILSALDYCHSRGVAHLDVSPENIWFDADGEPYLGDFDAVWVRPTSSSSSSPMIQCTWRHGKSSFMAPEMVLLHPLNPFAVDIFSLGSTIFTAVAKSYLLQQVDVRNPTAMVSRSCYKLLTRDPDQGSFRLVEAKALDLDLCPLLKDLIAMMTHCDPYQRLTLEGVKRHGWFKMYGIQLMEEEEEEEQPQEEQQQQQQQLPDGFKMLLYQRKESVEAA